MRSATALDHDQQQDCVINLQLLLQPHPIVKLKGKIKNLAN